MAVIGRLSRLVRIVEAELNRTFATHGLDAASFDVLATLRRAGAPYRRTPGELQHDAMVTSGAITQRLERLETRGLITRRRSSTDGRGVHVTLTEAGLTLIDQALPDHIATEHQLLAALPDDDRATLAATLRTLLQSLGDTRP